jgi:Protein of unknown function (DUF2829)
VPDGLDRFATIREHLKKFARATDISFFDVDIEDHGSESDCAVARNFIGVRAINESRDNLTCQPKENHMTFGEAIEALKVGDRVSRAGWNGKKMWLRLVMPHDGSDANIPYVSISTESSESLHIVSEVPPWVEARADMPPELVPWVASHADILAEDWFDPVFATAHTDDAGAI